MGPDGLVVLRKMLEGFKDGLDTQSSVFLDIMLRAVYESGVRTVLDTKIASVVEAIEAGDHLLLARVVREFLTKVGEDMVSSQMALTAVEAADFKTESGRCVQSTLQAMLLVKFKQDVVAFADRVLGKERWGFT